MSLIVSVHGIGQQFKGAHTLQEVWLPALRDGLEHAGAELSSSNALTCAFYGDLFRRKGTKSLTDAPYEATDVEAGFEQELLEMWWCEAAQIEPQVPGPTFEGKARTPDIIQRALNALSNSTFFSGLAQRSMIGDLNQVRSYLEDENIRAQVQRRVAEVVQPDTRVIIGHSLGSVVAYEALCAHPDWPVRTLVTLGAPLGIRNLIFDRLRPAPMADVGVWPEGIKEWFNIADGGDVVALVKELKSRFGPRVQDALIYNGATAHNIVPYLTAKETGHAIATGLKE